MTKKLKAERQAKIIEIINNYPINTQKELMNILREEGWEVTQATISRDIDELRIAKVPISTGKYRYTILPIEQSEEEIVNKLRSRFKEAVINVDFGENDIIIKTQNAHAPEIAVVIDKLSWPGIMGTIAGYDTVLVVTKSDERAKEIAQKFRELLIG